jgi:hypothetical protein
LGAGCAARVQESGDACRVQECQFGAVDGDGFRDRIRVRAYQGLGDGLPLSGLPYCGICGKAYYRFVDNRGVERYRCATSAGKAESSPRCGNPSIHGDALRTAIQDIVLSHVGNEPVTRRVFLKGEDHSRELEQVERAIAGLRDDADAGLYDDDRADYQRRMKNLLEKKRELALLPHRPDGWWKSRTGRRSRTAGGRSTRTKAGASS